MPKAKKTEEEKQILREVGRRIREARKKKGIKAAGKLGEMMNASLSSPQQSVSAWETGNREIGLLNLIKLAMALDISLDELVMGVVQEVKRKSKKKCTLRDACEFLFLTLPKATGATWSFSDKDLARKSTFDVDEHPCINLTIPMPPYVVYELSKNPPSKKMHVGMCGKQMAIFADTVSLLNSCIDQQPVRAYNDALSHVSTIPLDKFQHKYDPEWRHEGESLAASDINLAEIKLPSDEEAYRDQSELIKSIYAKK